LINKSSFEEISPKIERINLRNNEMLKQIENGAFNGLNELRHLNLSNTLIGKITKGQMNLPKLKVF
jgi:DNA replication protein DnaD